MYRVIYLNTGDYMTKQRAILNCIVDLITDVYDEIEDYIELICIVDLTDEYMMINDHIELYHCPDYW